MASVAGLISAIALTVVWIIHSRKRSVYRFTFCHCSGGMLYMSLSEPRNTGPQCVCDTAIMSWARGSPVR